MTFHPFTKNAMQLALGGAFGGAWLMLHSACGFGSGGRRMSLPGHSPFAFSQYSTLDLVGTVVGAAILLYCGSHVVARWRQLRGLQRTQDDHFFVRAGAPRWIYELLLGVAKADGSIGDDEHDVVQQILTRELPEKVLPSDLQNWRRRIREPRAPAIVARALRTLLDRDERSALLGWCHKVAAVRGLDRQEAVVLRELASILTPDVARS